MRGRPPCGTAHPPLRAGSRRLSLHQHGGASAHHTEVASSARCATRGDDLFRSVARGGSLADVGPRRFGGPGQPEKDMSTRRILDRTLCAAALLAALLAAGCGSGGGGGAPPPPPQLVQITAQNQDAVARAKAATLFSMTGVRALPLAPSPAPRALAAGADVTMRALGKVLAPARTDAKVGRLTVYEETLACTLGGEMKITIDDRDNDGFVTRGDTLALGFTQCRESKDSLVNGLLAVAISGASETPTSVQITGTFSYQMTVVEGSYTSSINGSTATVYTESIDPMGTYTTRMESTVTPDGLVAGAATPILSDTFSYDPGFNVVSTEVQPATPTPLPFSTIALNGTVHVASLGGRIAIATDPMTPIRDTLDAPYPESGQVVVTGRDSRLRMTVLDTERVRMELDANGDGTYDATKEVLWTELLP
jgi:hypothetical protein